MNKSIKKMLKSTKKKKSPKKQKLMADSPIFTVQSKGPFFIIKTPGGRVEFVNRYCERLERELTTQAQIFTQTKLSADVTRQFFEGEIKTKDLVIKQLREDYRSLAIKMWEDQHDLSLCLRRKFDRFKTKLVQFVKGILNG